MYWYLYYTLMTEFEINGFDESGVIGRNLRFVRVGLNFQNICRPFVYNILHFGSISVTKLMLRGIPREAKVEYIRMIHSDPTFSVDYYLFPPEHQIDVLRQFILLEEKQLFYKRGMLLEGFYEELKKEKIADVIEYLKRYERSPYWMESFIKSYGFRMVVSDLLNTSKVLGNPNILTYRVFSYVDGGFPFVFWWDSFLSQQGEGSRFSYGTTPVFGITKGDEYYPIVSVAGNIAFITSTVSGMIYPQNVHNVPVMSKDDLNEFYNEFSVRTAIPTFHKKAIFFGFLPREFQYAIPFTLHTKDPKHMMYEPFRMEYKTEGALNSFSRIFGNFTKGDIIIRGKIRNESDECINKEFKDRGLDVVDASIYLPNFKELLAKVLEESRVSNLRKDQITKIERCVSNSIKDVESILK